MKLDPKIIFYLKHRQQIDEWIELREHATEVADRFFKSTAPRVVELANKLIGAEPFISLDEPCPKLFLIHSHWRMPGAKWPKIGIGVEWRSSEVRFDETWSGVWIDAESDKGGKLAKGLLTTLKAIPGITNGFQSERYWPVWRYESPADPEFWNNLDDFSHQLVEAIQDHWTRFSSFVDKAVEGTMKIEDTPAAAVSGGGG